MPLVDLADLTPLHAERLQWFLDREDETTGFPPPLRADIHLSSRPKGIFKPRDLDYALSIRINLDSPYPDGDVYDRDDGTWFFAYHQENSDPAQRDREYTNLGLLRCIEDRIPVGVLRERVPDTNNRDKYDILGLAVPTGWADGFFSFEGVRPDGFWAATATAVEVLLADAEESLDSEPEEVPDDDYDARRRVSRQIVARRGQSQFRAALLSAYGGACAVTGTAATAVLEAAHIRPYRGPASNTVPNGLLLRADIHTLFDLALIAVDPMTRRIKVSEELAGTPYDEVDGTQLREPKDSSLAASVDALSTAWAFFLAAEQAR
ncbi:HNH endonuclease [Nocardioides seonyuensis]|uniref:HNH endonuclease n=1 Tax=Nocardioides seonyuensis TaxID=2518371 RepID=UPI00141EB72E|nr:HNH endonuclease [Nocardioides seonyuensis]